MSAGHCSWETWGVFTSVLLCWVAVKLFSQISINNREYKSYSYADFGGPEVFVTVIPCLFKLLENNWVFFFFSAFCRVLSEFLLLANMLINWLSLWVRAFTESQTWCCQTDSTTFEAELPAKHRVQFLSRECGIVRAFGLVLFFPKRHAQDVQLWKLLIFIVPGNGWFEFWTGVWLLE